VWVGAFWIFESHNRNSKENIIYIMTITEDTITALSDDENWDMVIEPQRGLFELRLGELWRYKDLAR